MPLNNYKVLGQISSGSYNLLSIPTVNITSSVAFITTGNSHGLAVGDLFDISSTNQSALNVRYVTASVGNATQFQFFRWNANVGATSQTSAFAYSYANAQGRAISNKAKSNGIATLTTTSSHGFAAGDWITVGLNDSNFDGDAIVLSTPTSTTFTFVKLGADVGSIAVPDKTGAVAVQKALTVYTVPSSNQAVISTLVVANNLTHSAFFSTYIVRSGDSATAPPDSSIIFHRIAVNSGESYNATLGYSLDSGDRVVVRASHAGMYFNLFGTELS